MLRPPFDFSARRLLAWDWQLDAACAGLDTALFYQADNERGSSVRIREAKAKAICARCPVIDSCLKDALRNNEPYGVWGGLSADERYRLASSLGA
jgi:WhiB family redox-sensing transcriptional regulator